MNFDKEFKRARNGVFLVWVVVIFFSLSITAFAIWAGVKVGQEIEEKGLKGVVEEIWYGEEQE